MLNKMLDCARPLTTDDIHALEKSIGRKLPDNYIEFLLQYNGGLPSPDTFPIEGMPKNPRGIIQVFFGIDRPIKSSNLDDNYHSLAGRMPADLFPIACTPGGDVICLSLEGYRAGSVVLWDYYGEHYPPTDSNIYRIAPSFEEFISGLYVSEYSPER